MWIGFVDYLRFFGFCFIDFCLYLKVFGSELDWDRCVEIVMLIV